MANQQKRKGAKAARMRPRRSGARRRPRPRMGSSETRRQKISATIAPRGYALLKDLVSTRKAGNLSEAIDIVLDEMLRARNRAKLERAMAAYYEGGNPEAIAEENELAAALSSSVPDLLFDE